MLALITQLLCLGGCTKDVTDTGTAPEPYTNLQSWTDDRPGTAFGSALAADTKGVWVGVPEDAYGRVDRIEDGARRQVLSGSAEDGVGSRLAWSAVLGLSIGAPLASEGAGQLIGEDGSTLMEGAPGEHLGSAIGVSDDAWVVGGNGRIVGGQFDLATPGRPRSIVVFDNQVVAGIGQVLDGVWLEDRVFPTETPGSLAGWATCVADVDNDDEEELIIGAPGANRVFVLDSIPAEGNIGDAALTYTGDGHFGWALACRKGEFWVGAPLYGSNHNGAVYRVVSGDVQGRIEDPLFVGESAGSQMGFSLAMGPQELWVGSPGTGDEAGRVDCIY